MNRYTSDAAILACIRHCSARQDGRGRWRAEIKCATELAKSGDAGIALDCAAAARRLGAWIHTQGQRG